MKLWIPDVSEHQGKIDWSKLIGKIPGAIIRIGYGDDLKSQDDLYAVYNMKECTRLGIPFDVYIYSHSNSDAHIKSEIAHTKRVCTGFNPNKFWLDLEVRSCAEYWKRAAELWKEAFGDNAGIYSWQWAFEKHVRSGRRWVCAYGPNDGTKHDNYKPTISMDGWQFTSKGTLDGIAGNVDLSEWYTDFAEAEPVEIKQIKRIVTKKEVASLIMRHLCTHIDHGYTQDMVDRQGTGIETIDIYGKQFIIKGGDRDCSSAVISAYEAAGISCGGATYTGNMKKCMTSTGNFVWKPMSYTAQMGDTYLNEKNHTAMCLSSEPDVLMEFSINENGGTIGGKTGDQKQHGEYDETYGRGESHLKMYYDYPWDGILQCINDEISFIVESDGTISEMNGGEANLVNKLNGECVTLQQEKTNTDLAVEVIFNLYKSGEERKKLLGKKYNEVQKIVSKLWNSQDERTKAEKSYFKKFGCESLINK